MIPFSCKLLKPIATYAIIYLDSVSLNVPFSLIWENKSPPLTNLKKK